MARSLRKSAKLSLRRVRINVPSIRYKPDSKSIERDQRIEFLPENGDDAGSVGEETKEENHEREEVEDKEEGEEEEEKEGEEEEEKEEEEEEEKERVKVIVEEEEEREEEKEDNDGKSFNNGGGEGKKEEVAVVEAVEEEAEGGNRVMVVVDKALASTGALEWAITHTLQSQDTLFLLYFAKPFRKGKRKNRKREVKSDELVHTLKKLCQTKRPGIEVEIRRLEGKDKEKGQQIVEEAKKQQVTLLVVGQEKKPPVWRLLKRWAWKRRRGHGGVLKYCLENASCMTIAVKPKNRKLGGYLITTKRHRNFWLLA